MVEQTNVFGFSTEPKAGGDFTPIIKYDARSGRMFRIDRVAGNDGTFNNEPIDITDNFKAVFDFENIEVGWIDFPVGSAPSFYLVPMGQQLPPRPSIKHKNGVRILLKLAAPCGGDKRVREIAGSAKSFLGGVEQVFAEYAREIMKDTELVKNGGTARYAGQLPVISLASTKPVTTGTGTTKSTNYRPTFRIDGWVKRPDDLVHIPAPAAAAPTNGSGGYFPGAANTMIGGAPATGGQTVLPPNKFWAADVPQPGNPAAPAAANLDDDFG